MGKGAVPRAVVADHDTAQNITLNVLVFKMANEIGSWEGSIRFTDAEGNPVKGISVTLDP